MSSATTYIRNRTQLKPSAEPSPSLSYLFRFPRTDQISQPSPARGFTRIHQSTPIRQQISVEPKESHQDKLCLSQVFAYFPTTQSSFRLPSGSQTLGLADDDDDDDDESNRYPSNDASNQPNPRRRISVSESSQAA